MKTLVIIDMQYLYLQDIERKEKKILIDSIMKTARIFIANNWPILIITYKDTEYNVENRLCGRIKNLLAYKNAKLIVKYDCDGSAEILKKLYENNLSFSLIVGGVYSDECVRYTVDGLLESESEINIEIIEDGVWPNTEVCISDDNSNRVKQLIGV